MTTYKGQRFYHCRLTYDTGALPKALSILYFFVMVMRMTILLLFVLPLVFGAYAFQLEDKHAHFAAFFFGIILGALFLVIASFFGTHSISSAHSLTAYFLYVFFTEILLPVCIVAPCALIVSRFNFLTVPAALFGLATVKIYHSMFLFSSSARMFPIIMYLIIYTGTLFIFDALLRLCTEITFYYFAAASLCFAVFIAALGVGCFAMALYYFKGNSLAYGLMLGSIGIIGLLLHFFVHYKATAA